MKIRDGLLSALLGFCCAQASSSTGEIGLFLGVDVEGVNKFKVEACAERFPAQAGEYNSLYAKWLGINSDKLAELRKLKEVFVADETARIYKSAGTDPRALERLKQLYSLPNVTALFQLAELAKLNDSKALQLCNKPFTVDAADPYLELILEHWRKVSNNGGRPKE